MLRPEEQVFAAMLDGWRNQQLARRLAFATVEGRERSVRMFTAHAGAFPWVWSPQMVDEWMTDLQAVRRLRRSTLRNYQLSVKLFCHYITDQVYAWPAERQARFGTHPVQVVHEWTAITHLQDAEGDPVKRAFTREELQAFFDHADAEVARIRSEGRKGWLPRSGTRPCSRPRTPTGCVAVKPRCSTWRTSAAITTPRNSETGVWPTSGSARP
ncbi:hypothetical protein [Nonomuraea rubra]|uniref:Core-binding (CB) domain-containing protein n=2 Tax=Nonomuraea rubra TaxID=46180 RepID=A0A7X0NV76_9ACTN|nr:hypothetical protein [Nonomuraea rubra]MBB6550177.1 hypothetical protein [Nonomuraea rubra]